MPYRSAAEHEDVPRPVVGIGNDYPPSFELAEHRHRRGQLLYAANGVVAVSTPQGAWVAPPERAVWIPGGTPHAVRMVGAVQTRSVLSEPSPCPALGGACRVVAVSPLLRQLLLAAAEIPVESDEGGRDGLVMRLLVLAGAGPSPARAAPAARCRASRDRRRAPAPTAQGAGAGGRTRGRFPRLFRRETGMSFAEWRQQACLSVALPRLAAGEPITTIALNLGYDGPASFSTMFKRALGVPPSRYRP